MSRLSAIAARADLACESVGLDTDKITITVSMSAVIVEESKNAWTVEQGKDIARAIGVAKPDVDPFPQADAHRGFCVVKGMTGDRLSVKVFTAFEAQATA